MEKTKTRFSEVYIIENELFEDNRGWFFESYNKNRLLENGLDIEFIQDNHSMSYKKNVIRGLHFQNNPEAQTKLVRCIKGKILDVVVDIRIGSPTYKQWIAVELSAVNKKQLLIPGGFAHGYLTLENKVEVEYKVDKYYSKMHDRSIRYDDPEINVDWGSENPILSEKDLNAPLLKDSDCNFVYHKE